MLPQSDSAEQGSVMDAAEDLIAAIRAYDAAKAGGFPPLSLIGDPEVDEFFGTIPTLTDAQLDRLLTLARIETDRRATDAERERQTSLLSEVA